MSTEGKKFERVAWMANVAHASPDLWGADAEIMPRKRVLRRPVERRCRYFKADLSTVLNGEQKKHDHLNHPSATEGIHLYTLYDRFFFQRF